MPARIPSSIECTRCETYPVVIPATNPFNSENVMTLPITGASDGSKKSAQSVHQPEHASHGKTQHGFREAHPFLLRKRASVHCSFAWHSCPPVFRLFLPCRGCRCGCSAVPLRCIPDNHSNDAAGQNDFEVIPVLHVRDQKREDKAHRQAEQDSERHGIYLSRENARRDSRDQALHRRANNNANHLRTNGRRKPCRSAIDCAQDRAEQKSQQHFIHHTPPWPYLSSLCFTT